jgi:two-component system OmpR family response regulator
MTNQALHRILLVEDEADIQTVAQLALESVGGFTVEVCSSGYEAIDRAPGFAPDLILLDVMMPRLDGPATLKALRQLPQTAVTPVVFITAKVQPHEIERFKEMGALDVIAKPFDPMTLSATVSNIWQTHCYG